MKVVGGGYKERELGGIASISEDRCEDEVSDSLRPYQK